jgi:hypothetical protein
MQLVVPRAVRAAVRMLTIIWMMVFQVSFFMVFFHGVRWLITSFDYPSGEAGRKKIAVSF